MITLSCPCGRSLQVPDTMAGKRGRCPVCRQIVSIPAARAAAPELEFADAVEPAAKVAAGGVACPSCSTTYPDDVLLCIPCGIEIATGNPIGGVRPPRGRRQADADELPFHRVILGFFTAPFATVDSLPGRFQERSFLFKTLGFVSAAMVVILLGVMAFISHAANARPSARAEVSGEKWTAASDPHTPVRIRILGPNAATPEGEAVVVRIQATHLGTGRPYDGTVHFGFQSGRDGETVFPMRPASLPGEFVLEVPAAKNPGLESGIFYCWSAGRPPGDLPFAAIAPHRWAPASPPSRFKIPLGITLLVGLIAVLALLTGLVLNAGLLTVAARILGDPGSFVAMIGVLAFLTAIVYLACLPALFLPKPLVVVAMLGFGAAAVVLQIRGVMAVFGQSALKAICTTLLAGVISAVVSSALGMGVSVAAASLLAARIS